MYAIVTDGSITQMFNSPKRLVIDNVQYSTKIFSLWSKSELEAKGIYEVEFDETNKKDEQWYINTNVSYAFADSKVTASYGTATAKPHADSTWTTEQINALDDPGDLQDGDIKTRGLKYNLIKDLKNDVASELARTDWYITRNTEKSTAIPSSISTHRDAVRTKQAEMETAITNASDTPALETLYTYTTDSEGVQSRPLGELPTLES
jgi:hypothetical protein